MARLPVMCSSCGFEGLAPVHSVDGEPEATFTAAQEPCPRCGADARVVDGTYALAGDQLEVVAAPPESLDHLRAIARKGDVAVDGHEIGVKILVVLGLAWLLTIVEAVIAISR